jgi:pyruvate kinase
VTRLSVVVTVPPYADFAADVARHPRVSGLRLNTVMPLEGFDGTVATSKALDPVLERLSELGVPLWVDLKGRQLRVVGGAVPPFTEVRLSHRVKVNVPCDAFFDDGRTHARVLRVDGDRLILADGPRRYVGPGESVNIVDASLEIDGTLTPADHAYLEAMARLGLRKVMLSFVESPTDTEEVRRLLPGAELVCKIESRRGLDFAKANGSAHGRLMAARGDLYVEVERPHQVLSALRCIIAADADAMVASRILGSLARHAVPDSSDVSDVAYLLGLGYRTFMLGDEVCLRRDSVLAALNLLGAIAEEA